jgi:electron transport complex protein RnfC
VESPAIELADLSAPQVPPPEPKCVFDWAAADPDDLLERIRAGGLVTYRRTPVPLARWIARARGRRCRTLIANAVEHEPYVTADHRVLAEYGEEVMGGLAVLAKAVGAADTVLAADRRRTPHYESSVDAGDRLGIERIALPHKYPVGADAILTKVLTRREAPPGAGTMAVGAAVVDAATCLAVWHWVVCGLSPAGRVVTLAGPRVAQPANLWVPFGADCRRLAGSGDGLLLHGGPMGGTACREGAVVTPATNAVLSLEAARPPLPSPCIRCGWCTDHCPARLNVAALNDAFELSLVARARRAGAPACVECGVCSYVCPARLPLTHRVKQLKRRILTAARSGAAAGACEPT